MSPEATEEIIPTVIVIVADTDTGLPSGAGEAGFRSDIGEGSVAVVLKKMRCRRSTRRPASIEARPIREIDIEPTVAIVIKEGESTPLGFNDVALAINTALYIGNIQSCLARYIHKCHRRGWRSIGNRRGLDGDTGAPFPERQGESIEKSTAQDHKRRAEKVPSGKNHGSRLIIARESKESGERAVEETITAASRAPAEPLCAAAAAAITPAVPLWLSPYSC